jgi:hypothetical protein
MLTYKKIFITTTYAVTFLGLLMSVGVLYPVLVHAQTTAHTTVTQTKSASYIRPTIARIGNVLSRTDLQNRVRESTMNIVCEVSTRLGYRAITGSVTVIDPRGIALTNAHLAVYLLNSSSSSNVPCIVRTGSPARAEYVARLIYLPPEWLHEYASQYENETVIGTGENDYALIYLEPIDVSKVRTPLSYLPIEGREGNVFTNDIVLAGSYPAERLSIETIRDDLYYAASYISIQKPYTFTGTTVDAISLGGTILARSGSSGGAVVDLWGNVVGILSTSTKEKTTAERELRAITLSYIEKAFATSLKAATASTEVPQSTEPLPPTDTSLQTFLKKDLASLIIFGTAHQRTLKQSLITTP